MSEIPDLIPDIIPDIPIPFDPEDEDDEEKNMSKESKIVEKCLDEMYRKSDPPTTWNDIKKKYSGKKTKFYNLHRITIEDYERIKKKYEKKLSPAYRNSLDMELLNYSPKFFIRIDPNCKEGE